MKVLVTLPNGRTTYCIECQKTAIGRNLLEKVCYELGIQCETEYFGLVYNQRRSRSSFTDSETSPSNLLSTPLDQSLPASSSPDNHLDQDSPRVRQWLNLRNPLGRSDGNFLNLALHVKFWVPVHLILQENVRNIFYMEARQCLLENRLFAKDWANAVKLSALLAHADGVKCDPRIDLEGRKRGAKRKSSEQINEPTRLPTALSVYEPYTLVRPSGAKGKLPAIGKEEHLNLIAEEHRKYQDQRRSSAKYWLLFELEKLEGFGQEQFVVPAEGPAKEVEVLVGPEGVVYTKGEEKIEIPFSAIQRASSKNRTFRLKYLNQSNCDDELVLKMSPALCTALYRAVTEKHDFYSCETVRSDVTTQFIRDFKGTFLSIFNEDTELGKKYVFDIQRTCREVHDHARRTLHRNGVALTNNEGDDGDCGAIPGHPPSVDNQNPLESSEQVQAEVKKQIAEIVTCKICMDKNINAFFAACGHVVSCMECASQCERCPMCRAEVKTILKLFLPTELQPART